MIRGVFIILFCYFASTTFGATYYLDIDGGDDTGAGSQGDPWQTIGRALPTYGGAETPVVTNGDTINMAEGNYGAFALYDWVGSNWIIYASDPNEAYFTSVIIDGYTDAWVELNGIKVVQGSDVDGVSILHTGTVRLIDLNVTGEAVWNEYVFEYGYGTLENEISTAFDNIAEVAIYLNDNRAGAPDGWSMDNIIVDGCETQYGKRGIMMTGYVGEGWEIINNHVHHTAMSMVKIDVTVAFRASSGTVLIEGNHIHDLYQFYTGNDMSHASGISIKACQLTVRNNIVHATGSTGGIAVYPNGGIMDYGFQGLLIENNLIYDNFSNFAVRLWDMGEGDVVFRNNTIIGRHSNTSGTGRQWYETPLHTQVIDGGDGSGLEMYNNIVVGVILIGDGLSDYTEDYNYFYAANDQNINSYVSQLDGANTVILTTSYSTEDTTFESDFFVSPYWINHQNDPHRQNLNDSFLLLVTAEAVDFGDPNNAPDTDLLGNSRIGDPDAGAYEYTGAASTPSITSPTVSAVTTTTATLGANVTSIGGAALTLNGTVWDTSSTPTANEVDEGGHTTGVFSHGRTGLTAGTKIYYRGVAENSEGKVYSAEDSFYTEPATQPTNIAFSSVGNNGMTISWDDGNGDGRIVVIKAGGAVDSDPVDGTEHSANTVFQSGAELGSGNFVVFRSNTSSIAITGLNHSTTYHVAIYEYTGTGSGLAGINYQQDAPLTGNQTTTTPPTSIYWIGT